MLYRDHIKLGTLLIVLFAFVLALFLTMLNVYALAIFTLALLGWFLLFKPSYYVLFWLVLASVSNKIEIPQFEITSYGVINLFMLPLLISKIFISYRQEYRAYPVKNLYSLFLAILFLSIWYSPVDHFMGVRKYCNFLIPFLLSVLMVGSLKISKQIKEYLAITLVSISIIAMVGTIMFCLGYWVVHLDVPRAIGVLEWPNSYALFLNINLAVALSLAVVLTGKFNKIACYIISSIVVISMIPTFSKSGYMGLVVTVSMILLLSFFKKKKIGAFFTVGAILLVIGGATFFAKQDVVLYRLAHHESLATRIVLWKSIWYKIFEHPFIGNGFMSSVDIVKYSGPFKTLSSTHNLFLMLLLETGLIGLMAFIVSYIFMLFYAIKVFLTSQEEYVQALSIGFITLFISAFIYSFVGDSLVMPMINLYFWFYFSFLICFEKSHARMSGNVNRAVI